MRRNIKYENIMNEEYITGVSRCVPLEAPVKAFHGYLVTSEEQVGTRQE
jgi:hypothetical protein